MEFLAKSVEPEVAVTLDPRYRSFPAPQWDIFIAHAGADAFISGTTLFHQRNLAGAVRKMRKLIEAAQPELAQP